MNMFWTDFETVIPPPGSPFVLGGRFGGNNEGCTLLAGHGPRTIVQQLAWAWILDASHSRMFLADALQAKGRGGD